MSYGFFGQRSIDPAIYLQYCPPRVENAKTRAMQAYFYLIRKGFDKSQCLAKPHVGHMAARTARLIQLRAKHRLQKISPENMVPALKNIKDMSAMDWDLADDKYLKELKYV